MSRLTPIFFVFLLFLAAPAPGQTPPARPVSQAGEERPRPGDVIRLRIWREPDLSGEFMIDETGEVVLPKLGRMNVTGETARSLETRLVGGYAKFLTHSSIEVALLRRVQVMGAVRNPGLYPVDATMTVADALALAGGAIPTGDPNKVELVRDGKRQAGRLLGSTRIAQSEIRSGDQLYVPERSWLSRNTGVVASGVTAGVSLLIAIFTR